jgi:hypothetical protein
MVMPTDLCSCTSEKASGPSSSPIRQPSRIWNTSAAAISQCRTIATVA